MFLHNGSENYRSNAAPLALFQYTDTQVLCVCVKNETDDDYLTIQDLVEYGVTKTPKQKTPLVYDCDIKHLQL